MKGLNSVLWQPAELESYAAIKQTIVRHGEYRQTRCLDDKATTRPRVRIRPIRLRRRRIEHHGSPWRAEQLLSALGPIHQNSGPGRSMSGSRRDAPRCPHRVQPPGSRASLHGQSKSIGKVACAVPHTITDFPCPTVSGSDRYAPAESPVASDGLHRSGRRCRPGALS